jgi:hypothetical protein
MERNARQSSRKNYRGELAINERRSPVIARGGSGRQSGEKIVKEKGETLFQ